MKIRQLDFAKQVSCDWCRALIGLECRDARGDVLKVDKRIVVHPSRESKAQYIFDELKDRERAAGR